MLTYSELTNTLHLLANLSARIAKEVDEVAWEEHFMLHGETDEITSAADLKESVSYLPVLFFMAVQRQKDIALAYPDLRKSLADLAVEFPDLRAVFDTFIDHHVDANILPEYDPGADIKETHQAAGKPIPYREDVERTLLDTAGAGAVTDDGKVSSLDEIGKVLRGVYRLRLYHLSTVEVVTNSMNATIENDATRNTLLDKLQENKDWRQFFIDLNLSEASATNMGHAGSGPLEQFKHACNIILNITNFYRRISVSFEGFGGYFVPISTLMAHDPQNFSTTMLEEQARHVKRFIQDAMVTPSIVSAMRQYRIELAKQTLLAKNSGSSFLTPLRNMKRKANGTWLGVAPIFVPQLKATLLTYCIEKVEAMLEDRTMPKHPQLKNIKLPEVFAQKWNDALQKIGHTTRPMEAIFAAGDAYYALFDNHELRNMIMAVGSYSFERNRDPAPRGRGCFQGFQ